MKPTEHDFFHKHGKYFRLIRKHIQCMHAVNILSTLVIPLTAKLPKT